MGKITGGGGGDYQKVPEGQHEAICFRVVDAGTRYQENQYRKGNRHVGHIFWELPELPMEDGRPMTIGNMYTWSTDERSNLHKHLVGWKGESLTKEEEAGFESANLLGARCRLEVKHSPDGQFANVVNIFQTKLKPSRGCDTVNPQEIFELDDYCLEFSGDSCNASKIACDVFEGLPAYIQRHIAGSDEPGQASDPCLEVKAAIEKGQRKEKAPVAQPAPAVVAAAPAAAVAAADDDFEDDIPF